jgi:trehalose-phosphatase
MNQFPELWTKSAAAAELGQRLRSAPRSLLMLDYDGTLAPFHIDRFEAIPYPGVEELLSALSGLSKVRLVLVSGRSARELRDMLRADVQAEIWGSHGRERLGRDGGYQFFPLTPVQQGTLDQLSREMATLGLARTLEVKPSSIAIHWRSFDPATQEHIRSSVQSVFARLGETEGLHLLPFDGGVELRSKERTKGTAVAEVLAEEPTAIPTAYLGDDLTDEDAFAALGNRGESILVRSEVRQSSARFWLRPPEDLLQFLDVWTAGASV